MSYCPSRALHACPCARSTPYGKRTLEMQCLCVRQLAGTGVAVSIAYPGMTSTAMTADWGAAGRTAAAMLVAWRSEAHATVTQARPARPARSRAHGSALWPLLDLARRSHSARRMPGAVFHAQAHPQADRGR